MLQDLLRSAIVKAGIVDGVESIHARRKVQCRHLWRLRYENVLRRVVRRPFGHDFEMAAPGARRKREDYPNGLKSLGYLSHGGASLAGGARLCRAEADFSPEKNATVTGRRYRRTYFPSLLGHHFIDRCLVVEQEPLNDRKRKAAVLDQVVMKLPKPETVSLFVLVFA